jgi:hypothetical protein
MFVMASLSARGASGPVRVRNLSPTGALVEGGVLPVPGEAVSLLRGSLRSEGKVVWCNNGRAGLRFDALVTVADWLPKGAHQNGQQRADTIIREIRTDKVAQRQPAIYKEVAPSGVTSADLQSLVRDLDRLSEALAEDDFVIIRHGAKLQVLDAASQALKKLVLSLNEPAGT